MARPLLRWVQVGHRATLREQSDLGHPGKTRHHEGVGLESQCMHWQLVGPGEMGTRHDCMGWLLHLGNHWGSDTSALVMSRRYLVEARKQRYDLLH